MGYSVKHQSDGLKVLNGPYSFTRPPKDLPEDLNHIRSLSVLFDAYPIHREGASIPYIMSILSHVRKNHKKKLVQFLPLLEKFYKESGIDLSLQPKDNKSYNLRRCLLDPDYTYKAWVSYTQPGYEDEYDGEESLSHMKTFASSELKREIKEWEEENE